MDEYYQMIIAVLLARSGISGAVVTSEDLKSLPANACFSISIEVDSEDSSNSRITVETDPDKVED